eukprot:CAMPEP_0184677614 /NCGR_PEP_ID=MMETSP0312-20130426/191_1 /TAXON_ID=31354 /ORGANISM="Compsopogon coeruleus, Strain SAG 36.94" /LENGTH=157 /DNA_ID=CAMNT_0027125575 /DNA_START=77 /DNA_END=550 /DNA_ORIENTATION=+
MAFVVSGSGLLKRDNLAGLCLRRKECGVGVHGVPIVMKAYTVDVTTSDGEVHKLNVEEDMTLLEAMEEAGLNVDSSCRAGVCMTCAAKVLSGDVDQESAALADEAKEQGYILTCSAFPRSNLKIEMNAFDEAYEMQYGKYELKKEADSGLLGKIFKS